MPHRSSRTGIIAPVLALAGVALALGATPAAAADSGAPADIQLGQFVIRPGSAPESKTFPAGSVLLRCHLTALAAPTRCVVLSESPKGGGLAALALKLAPTFQLKAPPGIDPTTVVVRMPLMFSP